MNYAVLGAGMVRHSLASKFVSLGQEARMVDPSCVPGRHDVFLCGDDDRTKRDGFSMLVEFGWTDPIDLGSLTAARSTKGMMPFWLRMSGAVASTDFNYEIVTA